jgi:hypothetical protein
MRVYISGGPTHARFVWNGKARNKADAVKILQTHFGIPVTQVESNAKYILLSTGVKQASATAKKHNKEAEVLSWEQFIKRFANKSHRLPSHAAQARRNKTIPRKPLIRRRRGGARDSPLANTCQRRSHSGSGRICVDLPVLHMPLWSPPAQLVRAGGRAYVTQQTWSPLWLPF